jgi:DNA-binding PadR family transcriptional regulator
MTEHTKLKPHWFHILLSLADRELHGTAIMEEVLERTEGGVRLWPGKLYGALRALDDAGLIREVEAPDGAPTEGGRRRFYALTRRGRAALREEVERLAALVRVARMKGAGGGAGERGRAT